MKRSERLKLYQCSNAGLIRLMNDPKYANNKSAQFSDMLDYLSRHGLPGTNTKDELLDMVYAARNELLAQAGKNHIGQAPFSYDDLKGNYTPEEERRVKDFIRDPVSALKKEFKTIATNDDVFENETDYDKAQYYLRRQANASMLFTEVSLSQNKAALYEDGSRADVMSRLTRKLPGNEKDAAHAYKKLNGNFITSLFRKPSKEYRKFAEAYEMFSDPKRANNGDVADLEKKTTAYLKHVIPEYEYSKDMPKEQWLSCLPKGQRARAAFCLNVIESINEHKEAKPFMDNVEKAAKGLPIDKSVDSAFAKQSEVNQKEFQKDLKNEIEEAVKEEEKEQPDLNENNLDLGNGLSN